MYCRTNRTYILILSLGEWMLWDLKDLRNLGTRDNYRSIPLTFRISVITDRLL